MSDCVERATPLVDLIRMLGLRDHLFVLERDRVRSIVTHADLGAAAVSMVVLAYILAFERACRELLAVEQVDVLSLLTDDRLGAAERIFSLRRQNDAELELVDCLQFGDWRAAVRRSERVCERLGYPTGKAFKRSTKHLEHYRNTLAHGGSILDGLDGRGMSDVIDEVLDLFELTDRAWAEVDRSTGPWDLQAATIIDTDHGPLTGPEAIDWHYSGTVHVVTAWNPQGVTRTETVNSEANRQLADMLDRRALTHCEVIGRSADRGWSERSFLIEGASRDEAIDLGHLFSQLSVFELTGGLATGAALQRR